MAVISFARGIPGPDLLPTEEFAECARRAGERDGARALNYGPPSGYPPLREWVAERHGVAPERVVLTTGSLQGFNFVARHFVEHGATVFVEAPCYDRSLGILRRIGAQAEAIPLRDDGLDVDALAAALGGAVGPKLVYTIPTFQNPTGRTLPSPRRARLAEIAVEHGLWIIEDDPYGELRYDGEPLAPIGAQPGAGDRTVTISSLSKVLAPGLRIGWLRAPDAILRPLAIAKQAADLHTSTVDQIAARTSLEVADLDAHIAVIRAEYRRRRDALLGGLADALPPGSTFNRPDGGMFVWARLPAGWDAAELLKTALRHDVAFVPGFPFFALEPDARTLRLSFTTHVAAQIAEGLVRLRHATAP